MEGDVSFFCAYWNVKQGFACHWDELVSAPDHVGDHNEFPLEPWAQAFAFCSSAEQQQEQQQ